MTKTILIPTDFSIESLRLLRAAAQTVETGNIQVVFLHCVYQQNSIISLLFSSKESLVDSLMNEDFKNACRIIRNKYSTAIHSIRTEIFTGTTHAAFRNFLDGNGIDEVLIPKNYTLQQTSKSSFDPMSYIRGCNLPTIEVSWRQTESIPEKNQLAELFLSDQILLHKL